MISQCKSEMKNYNKRNFQVIREFLQFFTALNKKSFF